MADFNDLLAFKALPIKYITLNSNRYENISKDSSVLIEPIMSSQNSLGLQMTVGYRLTSTIFFTSSIIAKSIFETLAASGRRYPLAIHLGDTGSIANEGSASVVTMTAAVNNSLSVESIEGFMKWKLKTVAIANTIADFWSET